MKVAVGLRRVAAGKRTSGRRAAQIALCGTGVCKIAFRTGPAGECHRGESACGNSFSGQYPD